MPDRKRGIYFLSIPFRLLEDRFIQRLNNEIDENWVDVIMPALSFLVRWVIPGIIAIIGLSIVFWLGARRNKLVLNVNSGNSLIKKPKLAIGKTTDPTIDVKILWSNFPLKGVLAASKILGIVPRTTTLKLQICIFSEIPSIKIKNAWLLIESEILEKPLRIPFVFNPTLIQNAEKRMINIDIPDYIKEQGFTYYIVLLDDNGAEWPSDKWIHKTEAWK